MVEPDRSKRPLRPISEEAKARAKGILERPPLTQAEKGALLARLDRHAINPRLSDEQRAKARRRAGILRKLYRSQRERDAKKAQAARAHYREQLSHEHMILLSEMLVGWAQDSRFTRRQAASLLTMSDQLCDLADEVGPEWNPPEPKRLSLMGFMGRLLADSQ